ncbi:MAG: ATP-binding protein [Rickettsiaceae bacterium]|nr:ATP-binding protein [Rickettsiaceae bacterium]
MDLEKMINNIDSGLFIGFLVANLALGLWASRDIKTIKEYAIGDRNFNTSTLVATIVATWVSGSFFFNRLTETYSNGLYYLWGVFFGPFISLSLMALVFAPRMGRFLGKISVSEAMGDLYGREVRIISAIAGIIASSGRIAVQFKVAGLLFVYSLGMESFYGVIYAALVIIIYSSVGGIKSVTFTDVIQFMTFGIILPIIGFYLINEIESLSQVSSVLKRHESFNYEEVFDFSRPKSLYYLFLFLYMIIPSFDPPMFQRIVMARNTSQAKTAFGLSAIIYLVMSIVLIWVAILIVTTCPNIDPKEITKHIIFNYSYDGLKGLTLICIMAMVMSTADSYINCGAVIFVHDFLSQLKINPFKNELIASRFASLFIGLFSLVLALRGDSLLKIVLACNSFYMPIVSVPLIFTILGFRTKTYCVLGGMFAGFVMVVFWNIMAYNFIDPIVPGMMANTVFFLLTHYLFEREGGWREQVPTKNIQNISSPISIFKKLVYSLNPLQIVEKSVPKTSSSFVVVGLFCMATIYATMHTMPRYVRYEHIEDIKFIIFVSLVASTLLLSHPLWLWKNNKLISSLLWHFVILFILLAVPFSFILLTNFATNQLMIFMINLIIIAGLLRWQIAVFLIPFGMYGGFILAQNYFGATCSLEGLNMSVQFMIVYTLLLVTSIVVVIFRPKQEYQIITERRAIHLEEMLDAKEEEVRMALALKSEFIRNVNHEYHTPMTGIISLAQGLKDAYGNLRDKQRLDAISMIVESALRLSIYEENIRTLAKLSNEQYQIHKEKFSLSALMIERVGEVKKLYIKPEEENLREFTLNIQDGIWVNMDKKYIIQLIDNLIINAIKYCKEGRIQIIMNKNHKDYIEIIVEDEGIGIPTRELGLIFEPFTVSSNTKTPAGGRGVGLSACMKIVEAHGGEIESYSDGKRGAKFTVRL